MPKFPEPPSVAELRTIGPEIHRMPAGTLLWRVHFGGGPQPSRWNDFRTFGPTGARFDHHEPPPHNQARAILYAAAHGPTCLAEVFQDTRAIDCAHHSPWLAGFRLEQPLTLLDLAGPWPTRAGASTAIHSGPRPRSRRWSVAAYEAFPGIEGLLYCSSMDAGRPALALYERALAAMPPSPTFHRALVDPSIHPELDSAALRFGYALVGS